MTDHVHYLPEIPWGKRAAFWKMILCNRDSATLTYRNPKYHDCHEHLTPRMRAILLDWLIAVLFHNKLFMLSYFKLFILCVINYNVFI